MKFHSRAIPRFLLTDSAVLLTPNPLESDLFCDGYNETELKNVRIEHSVKKKFGENNIETQNSGVLYYDCKNSSPKNLSIGTNMKLKIGEKLYLITQVEVFSDTKPHHIKAVLR